MNFLVLALYLMGATSHVVMPQLTTIVRADSSETYYDDDIGNVKVKFSDGHTEMWTRHGKCCMPQVSDSGLVGWLYYSSRNYRGVPIFDTLRVVWLDEHHRDFVSSDFPFIETWAFADKDTCVVIRSRRAHGPADYLKFRLNDGTLLGEVEGPEGAPLPDWAAPIREP